jgi:hypothetical protein
MMKRTVIALACLSLLVFLPGVNLFSQTVVFTENFNDAMSLEQISYGDWRIFSGRLYQNDADAYLAKINLAVPQSGTMQYEFTVKYEQGGFEDRHAGFGIHIFVDRAWNGKSWGNGNSFMLWLNYDENPTYGSAGFMAQVYKSTSPTKMDLVGEFDLNQFTALLSSANAGFDIPVRIKVDSSNGSVWIEDPTRSGYGYRIELGTRLRNGNYVALRTNSLSASFDNIKITKLR